MKKLSLLMVAFAFPLLALGCADEGVADGGSGSAVDKCNAYINAVCAKFVGCKLESSMASCVKEYDEELHCSKAVGVAANYATCLADVNATTCEAAKMTDDPPPSCNNAILQ